MSNKIKIAFALVTVSNNGGIARVTSLMTSNLHATNNYEIHVIGFKKHPIDMGYLWHNELHYHHLVDGDVSMKKGIFKATRTLRNILKENKITVLVACSSIMGPLGVLATRCNRTRLVYWDHSSFFENTAHDFILTGKKFTARFADVVVPLTKHDEANYRHYTAARRIVQIYNPIDSRLENVQHQYNPDSKRIVSVGRLTYLKNFELLADVARIVFQKHPDFTWHIYGKGEDEEKIKNKIEENGLGDKLFLEGYASDIYAVYPDCVLMVMTSRSEGFPMTLIEGMANKLPLVSFDIISGPNEIIMEGENGHLVPPLAVDIMADKIIDLLDNRERRIAFANKNLDYMDKFSMKSVIHKWDSILK
ncbi:glycosyltransferase [Maribacter sp. CXY002]|uniref:glycosyltransferase n=1 Tax=Maribacter luteocoastalis TaxID=3407671 RepID=UPI003B672D98